MDDALVVDTDSITVEDMESGHRPLGLTAV